jgi:predicted metal-dependent HD superfamily phosphohydrolase
MLHTQDVVEATKQIAHHYRLNEHDYFLVVTAAWFHDLGYYSGETTDHETQSVAIAAEFLRSNSVNTKTITEIGGCIMATRMPQLPVTLLQKIVCDADLFNLGTRKI